MGALLAIVFIVLFGGMLFALASGFVGTERERERAASASSEPAPEIEDRSCPTCGVLRARVDLDEVVRELEQRVRLETLAVAQFVDHPSLESLYGRRIGRGGRTEPPEHN